MPSRRRLPFVAFVLALWLPVAPVSAAALGPASCAGMIAECSSCEPARDDAAAQVGCSLLCTGTPALPPEPAATERAFAHELASGPETPGSGWLTGPEPYPPRSSTSA